MFRNFAIATMVLSLGLVGCEKESEPGGPGVNANDENREESTFTVSVPTSMEIAQGKNQEATVTLNRGDLFTEGVTIEFMPPAGVTVTPATQTIASGTDELKVLVEVAADATAGETKVMVKGTPESGAAVDVEFPLTITEAENNADGS